MVVLLIANDRDLMGRYRNRLMSNILVGTTIVAMTLAAVAFFVTGPG